VKFGERGKSFGRHSPTSAFKRGLTVSLTKGWPWVCGDLVKGSIGFTGGVFEVMTQVNLGLINVGRYDSADLVIGVNDVN
jgi:hypothetical protein